MSTGLADLLLNLDHINEGLDRGGLSPDLVKDKVSHAGDKPDHFTWWISIGQLALAYSKKALPITKSTNQNPSGQNPIDKNPCSKSLSFLAICEVWSFTSWSILYPLLSPSRAYAFCPAYGCQSKMAITKKILGWMHASPSFGAVHYFGICGLDEILSSYGILSDKNFKYLLG